MRAVRLDWSLSSAVLGRLDVDRVVPARPRPQRRRPHAPARRAPLLGGSREEEVGARRARRRLVVARGSRRGSCPAGSPGSARRARRRGRSRSVWFFVPRASSTWTRVARARPRGRRRLSVSTSSPRGSRPKRRHGAGGRAVHEERSPRAAPPARSSPGRSPPDPSGPGCSGPIRTEFSSLKTTGVAADTPGTSSSEAKPGGWAEELSTLGVTRRSEPTTNLRVGGLRGVVGRR